MGGIRTTAQSVFSELVRTEALQPGVTVLFGGYEGDEDVPLFRLAQMSRSLANDFRGLVLRSLGEKARDQETNEIELGEYDPQYQPASYEVRWVRLSDNVEVRRIVEAIPEAGDAEVFDSEESRLDDVRFFVVNAKDNQGHRIRCYRTLTPSKKLTKTRGILAHLVGTRFEKIEETTLIFEPEFQVVEFQGYLFIFPRARFSSFDSRSRHTAWVGRSHTISPSSISSGSGSGNADGLPPTATMRVSKRGFTPIPPSVRSTTHLANDRLALHARKWPRAGAQEWPGCVGRG
jgi:hypothetical protein